MSGKTLLESQAISAARLPDWKLITAADLDGDGKTDLVFQNQQTGAVSYWLLGGTDGTALLNQGLIFDGSLADENVVLAFDLNNNDKSDLLLQNSQTGEVAYWLLGGGNGTQITKTGTIPNPSADWELIAAPDLDGDGNNDLLFQNRQSGAVTYWLMQGTTIRARGNLWKNSLPDWKIVATADLNDDGHPDILLQNQKTGAIYYWLLSGTDGTTIAEKGYLYNKPFAGWRLIPFTTRSH